MRHSAFGIWHSALAGGMATREAVAMGQGSARDMDCGGRDAALAFAIARLGDRYRIATTLKGHLIFVQARSAV